MCCSFLKWCNKSSSQKYHRASHKPNRINIFTTFCTNTCFHFTRKKLYSKDSQLLHNILSWHLLLDKAFQVLHFLFLLETFTLKMYHLIISPSYQQLTNHCFESAPTLWCRTFVNRKPNQMWKRSLGVKQVTTKKTHRCLNERGTFETTMHVFMLKLNCDPSRNCEIQQVNCNTKY